MPLASSARVGVAAAAAAARRGGGAAAATDAADAVDESESARLAAAVRSLEAALDGRGAAFAADAGVGAAAAAAEGAGEAEDAGAPPPPRRDPTERMGRAVDEWEEAERRREVEAALAEVGSLRVRLGGERERRAEAEAAARRWRGEWEAQARAAAQFAWAAQAAAAQMQLQLEANAASSSDTGERAFTHAEVQALVQRAREETEAAQREAWDAHVADVERTWKRKLATERRAAKAREDEARATLARVERLLEQRDANQRRVAELQRETVAMVSSLESRLEVALDALQLERSRADAAERELASVRSERDAHARRLAELQSRVDLDAADRARRLAERKRDERIIRVLSASAGEVVREVGAAS